MKRLIFFFGVFLFFLFVSVRPVQAAKFVLSPESKSLVSGDEFQVNLTLDTQGKDVNGVQASLTFSKDLLEIKDVAFFSIFPSNFKSIDNSLGKVQLASGEDLPTASFKGSSNWVTLNIRAKTKGEAKLEFICFESSILELGTTSNLLDCPALVSGTYQIGEAGITPAPTSTPTPSQPPACSETSPGTPTNLSAASGSDVGQVTLSWTKVSGATHYSLVFGPSSKNYKYGAANIGDTNQYIVKALTPGNLYYFAIAAVRNCASSGFSQEVSSRAKSGAGKIPTYTPEIVVYKPISEAFPEIIIPSPTPTPTIQPTPALQPEKGKSLIASLSKGMIMVVIGLILLALILKILIRRRPPEPPTIVKISETPPSPPPTPPVV
ncbi:MAG: fibronectin type III domain-containing protein [Patescibacteria group bacterium]